MALQPSSFGKLNDINEDNVSNMNMNKNFLVMYNAEKYINEHCHILSFSQNYDEYGYCQEGTNHPAMWAHYADDSKGVCIVIDKEAFIRKCYLCVKLLIENNNNITYFDEEELFKILLTCY